MSRDGYLSCASCHLDGTHDGQVWDFTQVGEGLRNTIDLTGRAGTGHGNVHWTANFDEIQDFENDIRTQFSGNGFIREDRYAAVADPLGAPKARASNDLDALAAYVASLSRFPDSPHRGADGWLTQAGVRGREVFLTRGCADCHAGPRFTDTQRHDVGTTQPSSGMGIGAPLSGVGFETPTLQGIWDTAPYLHNGSAATLDEVLDYESHVGVLSPGERGELVAYLLQIDGNEAAP
jgi:cytochrome c peroxidase